MSNKEEELKMDQTKTGDKSEAAGGVELFGDINTHRKRTDTINTRW